MPPRTNVDTLLLHKKMFSYLTSSMFQAELAAILANASSNASGTTFFDTSGDFLTLLGVTPTMLTADAKYASVA